MKNEDIEKPINLEHLCLRSNHNITNHAFKNFE